MKTVSIIIPALNEKEGITGTIQAVPRAELNRLGYQVQVVVVDNGSTDGTGDLARQGGADVVKEPRRGYGHAYRAGFARASGDIIATADADHTYPLEDIPRLVLLLEEKGLDFITTDRFAMMQDGAMSRQHRIGNAVLTFTSRILFRLPLKDTQSGMWVFRKELLGRVHLRSNGMPLSEELKIEACHYLDTRWAEVPIEYRARVGRAKLRSWRDGCENLLFLAWKRLRR